MRREEMKKEAEALRKKGYSPFSWGDFWKTGYNGRAALRHGSGKQEKSAKSDPILWDCVEGPAGGCWVRYRRQSFIKKHGDKGYVEVAKEGRL